MRIKLAGSLALRLLWPWWLVPVMAGADRERCSPPLSRSTRKPWHSLPSWWLSLSSSPMGCIPYIHFFLVGVLASACVVIMGGGGLQGLVLNLGSGLGPRLPNPLIPGSTTILVNRHLLPWCAWHSLRWHPRGLDPRRRSTSVLTPILRWRLCGLAMKMGIHRLGAQGLLVYF